MQRQKELENQLRIAELENKILSDPSSTKIALPPRVPDLPQLQGAWSSEFGIVVVGQKVPLPRGNRVLELWLIPKAHESKPMPLAKVRPEPEGQFVILTPIPPRSIGETKALVITEEPAEGSLQPTTTPRWVGGIS